MQDFIHNLRRKPHHIKKRILYVSAPGITLIIGLLWFFSLGVGLNNENDSYRVVVEEVAPVSLVKDGGSGIFNAVKETLNDNDRSDDISQDQKESITVEINNGSFFTTIKNQFRALFTPIEESVSVEPDVIKEEENIEENISFWTTFRNQIGAIFAEEE